jgi:hypothetical protein
MKTKKLIMTAILLIAVCDCFSIAKTMWRKSCYFGGGASEGFRRYASTYIYAKNPFNGTWAIYDGKTHKCCCLQAGTDSYYDAQIWNAIGFEGLAWSHAFVNNSRQDAWAWTNNHKIAFKRNSVGDYTYSRLSLEHKWEDGILYFKFTGKMGMANIPGHKLKYRVTVWTHESEDDSIITSGKTNWVGSIFLENQDVTLLDEFDNLTGFDYTLSTTDSTVFEPDTNWIEIGEFSEDDVSISVMADAELSEEELIISSSWMLNNEENIKIYPNPISEKSGINVKLGKSLANKKVQIFDFTGRLIYECVIRKNQELITIYPDFNQIGIYLLYLKDENNEIITKEKILCYKD